MLEKILGWGYRVRKLRKKWDRAREKALKKRGARRKMLLQKLDAVENNLRTLEEQRPSRIERARLGKEVEINLAEVKVILKMKKEEFQREMQSTVNVSS